jgi:hypothetical protein
MAIRTPLTRLGNEHLPMGGVYTNGAQVAGWLLNMSGEAIVGTDSIVKHYTMLMLVRIQANASGRPGPEVVTGDYRRSWQMDVDSNLTLGVIKGTVWTDRPQALRLELGFVGEDALGRVYDDPPYPHAMPAVRQTEPEFVASMAALPGRLV